MTMSRWKTDSLRRNRFVSGTLMMKLANLESFRLLLLYYIIAEVKKIFCKSYLGIELPSYFSLHMEKSSFLCKL